MNIFSIFAKVLADVFSKIGTFGSIRICYGFFDEAEVPQELIDEANK
ncbi:cyclic lactone autoinducer peptide AgrD [Staphylococcus massiliensis]|uniref:AgrD n=1 Tax=Staphylococcus massiliensis S46 TaxID=1229783 RepID=K9AGM2_9STAP|nr:cyclic lactone autoinducer peptide [Staphylococcus massiliensis]EKU46404.1 hypothetical protein C273_09357 [Staphylococcus massiliensis S46]MCG3399884.1 cyclic lactone autoinducer peptide [Staphylococcus massiliensis]MCG3402884.1 cyclic lactone autoinducer peptide [Staphylococcus massiliensis]MCG3413071.1 cyclic lactone autoinducer peptide [Staphylococcus massiliensis]PNZ98363.1 cyclic lactone autoinducer peptide [Staphylococcus massiliensis CCUG 55927]